MENTLLTPRAHRATRFLVAVLILMLFYFVIAAIPASANQTRPALGSSAPRLVENLPAAPTSGAAILEVECIFPALDGTCSGSVTFQPREQKQRKPATRPGSSRRSNRWQLSQAIHLSLIS